MSTQTQSVMAQFERQQYLNLETVWKSGVAVSTPVWFVVKDGDVLYVRTPASSGKVKRIRNNPKVRVAPCDRGGNLRGTWVNGGASLSDEREVGHIDTLLTAKYGTFKKVVDFFAGLRSVKYVVIAIRPDA